MHGIGILFRVDKLLIFDRLAQLLVGLGKEERF